jgi:hypothetical protein
MPPVSTLDSWWSWFSKFQDEQRLERLQQCRRLEDLLKQCETKASSDYSPTAIEEFSGGLRIMKYFEWRGIFDEKEDLPNPLPPKLQEALVSSCARERHAVWACRGVAVGCGKELGALKQAFDEQGPLAILYEPRTAYESTSPPSSSSSSTIPCAESQYTLGACVRQGANDLLERQQQRKQDEQQRKQDEQQRKQDEQQRKQDEQQSS